jgi:hypothetical protein
VILAAAAVIVLAGCTKSNPLIGKWKLAPNAPPMCAMLDGVEFTENTMTVDVMGKHSANVTYGRDGDHYVVNGPSGSFSFDKNSDGIKAVAPIQCQLLPAG